MGVLRVWLVGIRSVGSFGSAKSPRTIKRIGRWIERGRWIHLDESLSRKTDQIILYRYVPLTQLLVQTETGQLTFVSPSKWDDRFEGDLTTGLFGDTKPLSGVDVVARCFTTEYRSDAIWRLYGDPRPTVRIKFKLVELVEALEAKQSLAFKAYISPVRYDTPLTVRRSLRLSLAELCSAPSAVKASSAAEIFFLKRDAYSFEREVRVILIGERLGPVYALPFPSAAISEVLLDPRLSQWEAEPLTKLIQRALPNALVQQSTLAGGIGE
jgi:hypothetical protein